MAALFVPRDRKSLFRQFLAGMYDAVVITDPNGHIIEINPRAEEHFGYNQEDVIDKPISFFIPGLSPEIVQRIRRGLDSDRHMMLDANGLNRDGTKFACEVTVSAIDLMDPGDLVFTCRNVERRRRVREMLRAKENAFDISQSALFTCDGDGRFTNVNETFCKMFDLADEEEARKHVFADYFTDEPLPENYRKALAGETTTVGIVAESEDGADDSEIEITLAPNRDGRKVKGVVGSVIKV
ncbi:MAG: PAS domain S-box protein [Kiritimatiellae bacterium]|nr:PAS domain S-box protein [Kiritimatiellia bacterium]